MLGEEDDLETEEEEEPELWEELEDEDEEELSVSKAYLLLLCLLLRLLSLLRLLDRLFVPKRFLPEGSTINLKPYTFLSFIYFTAASAS